MNKGYITKEIISNTSRKSVIRLIYLTVAFLILLNEAFYFYLKYDNPNLGYEVNAKKWSMLKKMNSGSDWVILGDSTCNQGLSVSTFEESLSTNAVNLCTIGDMLVVSDSWMLDQYIKKFGPPNNVLIIHTYNVWHRKSIDIGLASQLPVWSLIKERPRPWIFHKKDEIKLLAYKYIPLYSQKSSLFKIVIGIFQKNSREEIFFDSKGFMSINNADPKTVSISIKNHKDYLEKNKFEMSSENLEGLENVKELAQKYGFDIFIAGGPMNEELYNDENFQAYSSDIKSYLENFAKQSDKIYYISNIYTFPAGQMISADHIIADAAQEYSKKISEKIKEINFSNNGKLQ